MSNLGLYKAMTTVAKAVGGPRKLLLITAGVGFAIGRVGEAGAKRAYKTIRHRLGSRKRSNASAVLTFKVTSYGKSDCGLEFCIGEKIRVLESDGDAVLIEKLGCRNNPHFVSADFLQTVSDYN